MDRELLNLTDKQTKTRLMTFIGALKGPHWVEVKQFRRGRSLNQNAWYWSCIVKGFADFLQSQGEHYTTEDAHEILKFKFLRESIVNTETGEAIGERIRSTTKLTTLEMVHYCEDCRNWLAEFGIIVPDPDSFTANAPKDAAAA